MQLLQIMPRTIAVKAWQVKAWQAIGTSKAMLAQCQNNDRPLRPWPVTERTCADEEATLPSKAALADIGVQALQRVLKAEDPLETLVAITSAFPSVAARLSEDYANATLQKELMMQQQQMPSQGPHFLLNGISVRACSGTHVEGNVASITT